MSVIMELFLTRSLNSSGAMPSPSTAPKVAKTVSESFCEATRSSSSSKSLNSAEFSLPSPPRSNISFSKSFSARRVDWSSAMPNAIILSSRSSGVLASSSVSWRIAAAFFSASFVASFSSTSGAALACLAAKPRLSGRRCSAGAVVVVVRPRAGPQKAWEARPSTPTQHQHTAASTTVRKSTLAAPSTEARDLWEAGVRGRSTPCRMARAPVPITALTSHPIFISGSPTPGAPP
mmetsp:Transcript_3738/g.8520  ORF Transcript_3738/g.8520 Transcript_3738/m.8520 type:complete len:234 (-) Transcript_3738:22-723(-)